VKTVAPAQLVDTSADALLEEIRRKQQVMGVLPLAIGISVIGFITFLLMLEATAAEPAKWGMLALGILGLVSLPLASWKDRKARSVRVHYVIDPLGMRVQERIERLIGALERAQTIWSVNQEHVHGDWKRHAGAAVSVARRRGQARRGGRRGGGVRLCFWFLVGDEKPKTKPDPEAA